MKNKTPEDIEKAFKRLASSTHLETVSSPGHAAGRISLEQYGNYIERHASIGPDGGLLGGGDVARAPLQYVDPLFDPILLMFPKENLKELNRRLRHYYSYHPIIRNLINLHSTFPFNDMEMRCESKRLEAYWKDWGERIDLLRLSVQAQHDRELLGEAFYIGNWDDDNLEWSDFRQVPPENIEAHSIYVGEGKAFFLKPDEELRRLLSSSKEIDQAVAATLPDDFREAIKDGKPYFIENNRIIHYAEKPADYTLRGDSSVKAALRYLLLEDKLYMLLLAFCFPGEETVVMADGGVKAISDVQIGDMVLSHLGKIRPVTQKYSRKYTGEMCRIKIGGLQKEIECTPNHPLLTQRADGSITWCPAGELKSEDALLRPYKFDLAVPSEKLTPGQARLLGYYASEGCTKTYRRKNKRPAGVRFTFNTDELHTWVQDVQNLLKQEFKVDSYLVKNHEHAVTIVSSGINYDLAEWFISRVGTSAHNKKLSYSVFAQSDEIIREFLLGLLRGDAGWTSGRVIYTSVSKSLIIQTSQLLDRLGLEHNQLEYRRPSGNISYQLELTVKASIEFLPLLDPSIDFSNRLAALQHCQEITQKVLSLHSNGLNKTSIAEKLNKLGYKTWHGVYFTVSTVSRIIKLKKYGKVIGTCPKDKFKQYSGNYSIHSIKNISRYAVTELPVYNLEVAEEHSYLVSSGIAAHNCDRLMFPVKIWKIGSETQKWLPTKKHFDMLRREILNTKNDPDADILYHAFLQLDIKNLAANHEDLIKYFEWTQKRILIALAASESMFAESNPYAKDSMSIKLVMHRYMRQRAAWNRIMQQRMCLPIAKMRNFLKRTPIEQETNTEEEHFNLPAVDRYHIPQFFWRPSNLVSNSSEREFLAKLREKGEVDLETLHDHMGLDSDRVKARLSAESGTSFDPVYRKAREEMIKDVRVRNQVLRHKHTEDIELPTSPAQPGASAGGAGGLSDILGGPGASGPGRPEKAPGDKKAPPKAMIPPSVMPAREKLNEKDQLPAPKGENEPLL